MKKVKVYFSFDEETRKLVEQLGYVPKEAYCTTEPVFIPEHAEKNREIVKREIRRRKSKGLSILSCSHKPNYFLNGESASFNPSC